MAHSKRQQQRIKRLRTQALDDDKLIQWVYLIDYTDGVYKIGRTNNLPRRLSTLQTHYPRRLSVLHSFACHEATLIETSLHRLFTNERIRGEWFRLSDEDIKFVLSLHNFNCPSKIDQYARSKNLTRWRLLSTT